MKAGKKRLVTLLAALLTLSLLVSAVPILAAEEPASGTCGENLTWTLADGVLTISGTGDMAGSAFNSYRDQITSVVIEDGATSIGDRAFSGCSSLTSVTIPEGVISIGYGAFYNCTSLTSITIPVGVTAIGGSTFSGCSSLTSITIPDSVVDIGSGTFEDCTSLTSVHLPNGITYLGMSLFANCSSLTRIQIPDTVTRIADSAFGGCVGLTSIIIPESVTDIDPYAFYGCTGLTNIVFPDSVTDLAYCALKNCTNLTSVTLPSQITQITGGLFQNCSSLTSITVPSTVTGIYTEAFDGCTALQEIYFTGNMPSFVDCFISNSAILYYPAGDESWESADEETRETIGGTWQPYGGYKVIDGAESPWAADSGETLSFRADGALADCTGVVVDGALVDSSNYKLSEGSTIVEFTANYLKTLSAGNHTLRVLFKDGTAETTFTVLEKASTNPGTTESDGVADETNPKDGDSTVLLLPAGLMLACALSLLYLNRKKRVQ